MASIFYIAEMTNAYSKWNQRHKKHHSVKIHKLQRKRREVFQMDLLVWRDFVRLYLIGLCQTNRRNAGDHYEIVFDGD